MSALILTPDQARAVVGCDFCRGNKPPRNVVAPPCWKCAGRATARFIPSDTADRYQPGECIEVGFDPDPDAIGCDACALCDDEYHFQAVGRVRLGEAIPVNGTDTEGWVDVEIVSEEADGARCLTYYDGAPGDGGADVSIPHLTLWPEAFTPGTYAHPIIERSPS